MANTFASISIDVKGLRDVEERLQSLGGVAGTKVMRSVLFAASKPIMTAAKANAQALVGSSDPTRPSGSGALAQAIRRVYLKPRAGGLGAGSRFTVSVAPKTKDQTAIALARLVYQRPRLKGVYWGHFVEWGTGTNQRKGRKPRKQAAQRIFLRALQSSQAEAVLLFRARIERAVTRALKKQNAAE